MHNDAMLDQSIEAQIVAFHHRKPWHCALYVIDVNTTQSFCMKFFRIHFGNILLECLLRGEAMATLDFLKNFLMQNDCFGQLLNR